MLQSPIAVVHSGQPDYQPLRQPTAVTATTAATGYPSHHFVKFNRRKAIGIGTALIVAAAVGMILNVVDIMYEDERYGNTGLIGQGFWVGAVVIVAGVFGIVAGAKKTRGLIITFNVLCIVAASWNTVQFILSVIFAHNPSCGSIYAHSYYGSSCPKISVAMQATLAALAIAESIVAICGSVMCCKAACCCGGCCDNAPVSQTLMINDVPLTVIYQPQNHAISVAYAVPVQPIQAAYQVPTQNFDSSPPPYVSNSGQATTFDSQTFGAASLEQPGCEQGGQEEKHRI